MDAATVRAGLTSTSTASKAYPRIGTDVITGLQARLSHLSHLDDVLGSGKLRDLAAAELRLLTGLLTDTTHTADTEQQPPWCYWINDTEIHMLAGFCALDLGDPRRALHHFTTAQAAFDTGSFPGGAAIYLARAAEAHLALGDLDAAADLDAQALRCHTTIDSARGDQTLTGLRAKLARQGKTPAVREFLEYAPPP